MTIRAGADATTSTYTGRSVPEETSSGDVDGRSTRYSHLITVVARMETPVTIDQLADAMTRWEASHDEGDEKTWHDVHEELYLVDLPTLDRAGLVAFDATAGTIAHPEGQ